MKRVIAVGDNGYIDPADHQRASTNGGDITEGSVVRFYFGAYTWMDIKFEKDAHGNPCLQVRAMCNAVPSLSIQPSSGNTIFLVPGE